MAWYERAKWYSHLKDEMNRTRDWSVTIGLVKQRRNFLQGKAEKIAQKLGHVLGEWDVMNCSRCRKCGDIVHINNILAPSDGPDFEGRAILSSCRVHFDEDEKYNWSEFTQPKNLLTVAKRT